jgi:molecular chaperone GrpE
MENKSEEKNSENVEDLKTKNEKIEKEEVSVEDRLKETEDKLLRSLAELENQRRRFQKEIKDAFEYGGFNFARESLTLLDNLQRAKSSIKNDETLKNSKDLDKFLKNIEILEKDIVTVFEKNKINKIKSIKEKFDPNLHQAMIEIEDEASEPGTIVQEIQPGYNFGERLLRPAFVGVAKKKGAKKDEKKEDK